MGCNLQIKLHDDDWTVERVIKPVLLIACLLHLKCTNSKLKVDLFPNLSYCVAGKTSPTAGLWIC